MRKLKRCRRKVDLQRKKWKPSLQCARKPMTHGAAMYLVAHGRGCVVNRRQSIDHFEKIYRRDATDLVALAPDVIVSVGSALVAPLQQATRTIPIVFVNVPDPVGAGFVRSMAHPGGNITGFSNFEYSM